MRVLVISSQSLPTPPPYYGGLEAVAFADALRLVQAGHEVTLVASKHSKASAAVLYPDLLDDIERIEFVEVAEPARGMPEQMPRLAKEYDIAIDHSWGKPSSALLGVPTIWVVHGLSPYPPGWTGACVAGVSKFHAEYLSALYDVDAKVVYDHMVEEPYLLFSPAKDGDLLLFLGRIDFGKGITYFVKACERIKRYRCAVVGDDSEQFAPNQRLVAAVREKARKAGVEWFGLQTLDAKVSLLRRAKAVVVLPVPPYAEVFGLWALEAFLMGKPVVTTHYGAMPEYVMHGENGWLLDPPIIDKLVEIAEADLWPKMTPGEMRSYALERFGSRRWALEELKMVASCL
jgi:glycosyltransferase involved in cell wall biosynthesis